MLTRKLTIGNSNIGYDTCALAIVKNEKYRLIPGSMIGRKWHLRRAIAALNRGHNWYTTRAGDEMSIHITTPKVAICEK